MKDDKIKISLIIVGSTIITLLLFQLFFYITSSGYNSLGDSYCQFETIFGTIPAKYASFPIPFRSNYTGQLTLVDKNEKQLSNADYTVYANGRKVGTSFKAPGTRFVYIKIRGNSSKVSGRTFIRVKGGGPYITHYYFRHHSNPFIYYLIFAFMAIIFVAILWFVFLQKQFYPRFKNINKTVIVPNQAPIIIRFRGKRMIILTNETSKQTMWDKLLKGPIVYKTIPNLTCPIILKPTYKGGKILVVMDTSKYKCMPNPIEILKPAKIEDLTNKQIYSIN